MSIYIPTQVCHHYLVPLLSQIPLDASLFKKETNSTSMGPPDTAEKMETDGGEGSKENQDPLLPDLPDPSSEPPAVVIYMIDPFSYGVDNMELARLSSMAMIRCFSDILCDQRIPDTIRQSVYLQTVTLDTVYSVAGKDETVYNRAVNEPSLSFILDLPFFLFKVPTSLLQFRICCDTMLIRMKRRC